MINIIYKVPEGNLNCTDTLCSIHTLFKTIKWLPHFTPEVDSFHFHIGLNDHFSQSSLKMHASFTKALQMKDVFANAKYKLLSSSSFLLSKACEWILHLVALRFYHSRVAGLKI
jgi:hypothetical protein